MRYRLMILLVLACGSMLTSCSTQTGSESLQQRISMLEDSLHLMYGKYDTLRQQLADSTTATNYWFTEFDRGRLKRKGITQPIPQLTDSIALQTDLVPYSTELGGQMRVWNSMLLKDRWAIAEFTDGHITGTMLMKYTIQKDGSLQWQVLDSFED